MVLGVKANESNRPIDVGDRIGNGETRLAAMHHGEYRVASLDRLLENHGKDRRIDRAWIGHPSATHHQHDRRPIGILLGREHVHRERRSKFSAIDDVPRARGRQVVHGRLRLGGNRSVQKQ